MTEQLLLTKSEAAKCLRLSTRTLRKARRDGAIYYVLIGRAVRYTIDDLESFIDLLRQVQPQCPQPLPVKATRRPDRGDVIIPFHLRNRASGRDGL